MQLRVPPARPDRLHEDASWSVGGVARGGSDVLPLTSRTVLLATLAPSFALRPAVAATEAPARYPARQGTPAAFMF
jgi:hypothetical protein